LFPVTYAKSWSTARRSPRTTGAKSAGDAVQDFEKQFIRSLLNILNQALIVEPLLSRRLSWLGRLGFRASADDGFCSWCRHGWHVLPAFASGTDSAPGGLAWVGDDT
jgi:hypothetical protein